VVEFKFMMEKGMSEFELKYSPSSIIYAKLLLKGGKKAVLGWVSSVVVGILELQDLGLFHSDIDFRNTIRVPGHGEGETKSYGEEWVFKIIDFDYAFKVAKCQGGPRERALLDATKAVIVFWLHP
jgi:hypothetical protein